MFSKTTGAIISFKLAPLKCSNLTVCTGISYKAIILTVKTFAGMSS